MTKGRVVALVAGGLALLCALPAACASGLFPFPETQESLERPPEEPFDELRGDAPPPKPAYDPALVDPRSFGDDGTWRVNLSPATFSLDVAEGNDDDDAHLLELHASYAAAAKAGASHGTVLPSIDLIDGKAKQFDDGLVAAVEEACVLGRAGRVPGIVDLVRRMLAAVGANGAAAPRLAAAVEISGERADASDQAAKTAFVREFDANEIASKPSGFYDSDDSLRATFRLLRFLMQPIDAKSAEANEIASALAQDAALRADYENVVRLFDGMTNAHAPGSFVEADWAGRSRVVILPPARTHEDALAARLFPDGLPPNANLMRELIRRVRSGEVDLTPRAGSGWYDLQVHALETLLLPEKSQEHAKLLLTKSYKKRLIGAFAALMTKRRETHWRSLAPTMSAVMKPGELRPRLRLEPAVTYYLRTARAYAFVGELLEASLGEDALRKIRGRRDAGVRERDLLTETRAMRDLFYGCALVAAEDIGLRAGLADDEHVDRARCHATATTWLAHAFDDADLAADTRVVVPVYVDPARKVTRAWATLGVRLAKLEVNWVEPPKVRPLDDSEDWRDANRHELGPAEYLIPVDEFAEVELKGVRVLTREEFRAVCDRERTKAAIVEALRD